MAVKKARKQSPARKSVGSAPRKRTTKKASPKKSSPGLMSKATKVVRAVVAGAAYGAASGAVQGAVESGKKAAGLGQGGNKKSKPQGKK